MDCENKIYCQIDSILKTIDSTYKSNNQNNIILSFSINFINNPKGELENIIKLDGLNITFQEFKNLCSKIDFSCGNIFPEYSTVRFSFIRKDVIENCKQ